MLKELCCDNLGKLDEGRSRAIIDAAISKALSDLEDRGQDGKPREVVFKLVIVRKQHHIVVDVQAKAVLPPYRSGITQGKVRLKLEGGKNQPQLVFQEYDANNPDQPSLHDQDGEA